jgi:hypothetical protein
MRLRKLRKLPKFAARRMQSMPAPVPEFLAAWCQETRSAVPAVNALGLAMHMQKVQKVQKVAVRCTP